jgi:hypothetical protein
MSVRIAVFINAFYECTVTTPSLEAASTWQNGFRYAANIYKGQIATYVLDLEESKTLMQRTEDPEECALAFANARRHFTP